jgi:hypothetical protein
MLIQVGPDRRRWGVRRLLEVVSLDPQTDPCVFDEWPLQRKLCAFL